MRASLKDESRLKNNDNLKKALLGVLPDIDAMLDAPLMKSLKSRTNLARPLSAHSHPGFQIAGHKPCANMQR